MFMLLVVLTYCGSYSDLVSRSYVRSIVDISFNAHLHVRIVDIWIVVVVGKRRLVDLVIVT